MLYRSSLTIIVGLILGVCIVLAVQTPAVSQESQSHKVAQFKRWLDGTDPAKFYGQTGAQVQSPQARSERLRRIWSRSMRPMGGGVSSATSLKSVLLKGGLAGAAATVWINNGITLYHVVDCGETTCPEPLHMDVEFKQAEELLAASGASGAVVKRFASNGDLVASGMVTQATAAVSGGNIIFSMTFHGQSNISSQTVGYGGDAVDGVPGSSMPLTIGQTSTKTHQQTDHTRRFYTRNIDSTGAAVTIVEFGDPFTGAYAWENPVFQTGGMVEAPPEYQPAEGDYLASPQESDALYDRFVSDPEYDPRTDEAETTREQHDRRVGVLTPQHGNPLWTTENPDGSITTKFSDGTELTTFPNGTERLLRPDGTEEWTYPDGVTRTVRPDGTETTRWPDGTTRTRTSDGTEEWTDPNGAPRGAPTGEEYPEPDPPTQTQTPSGPTNQDGDSCASPRPFTFDVPDLELLDKFPFSLIMRVWDVISSLAASPVAPHFNLPVLGEVTTSPAIDSMMGVIRVIINLVFGVGMSLWFYRYVSGKGSE